MMHSELERRRFLYQSLTGVGGIALMDLLQRQANATPLISQKPHHAAKAKSCIFLSMLGGVSQMDSFDPKPALEKFDNTVMDWSKEKNTDQPNLFAKPRLILRSSFPFRKYGQSGRDVSSLFPHVAECVDDLAFVRSIQTENGNHPAAVFLMNTGVVIPGKPSVGAWTTYGLGTENQNLPAFVVLPDFRALPFSGSQQWGPGFLPASYQGTVLRWKGDPILNLKPPAEVKAEAQEAEMKLLRAFNQEFSESHGTNPDLQGRIDSYELAYRMQTEVPGALDIAGESQETLEMYGLNDPVTESFGKRCLMARKLVEKGVRFVQLYTPSQSWDGHTEIVKNHTKNAGETDKPIAALIKDLKRRGLLDSTLLVWMGEFGRTPDNPAEMRDKAGRDHNTRAMTIWLAGGGVKAGTLVGATDDLGFKAVENIYRMRDVHATVLHLMGLNDMRLTYYSAGRNQRLTDTGGTLIKEVIA
ncbi:DUF1501 domain-containing protein [Bryobacter aggregatus]|uniref:DUF1501 domain-containing protein n=1 Tax=Bryobacter aggregatus TaxID=360054 RepID=UPI00192E55FE|nr:DUF1501 domain-containing protein [Bryobacter aggregatus]